VEIFIAVLLGLVQGLTEFLPVSSSGHLVLLHKLLGIRENALSFTLIVHMGTLASVIVLLRKRLLELIKHPFSKQTRLLAAASVPTVLILFLFKGVFKAGFNSGEYLSVGFLITGVLLLVTHFVGKIPREVKEIGCGRAALMGAAQGIAGLPAISRSGATVCAGVLSGADRVKAAEFSFLMSIPVIIGSCLFEIIGNPFTVTASPLPLLCGFLAAFISGLLSLKFMFTVLKRAKLYIFSVYLFALAAVLIFI